MPSKKTSDDSLLEAQVIKPLLTFSKSSYYFLKKCEKPDSKRTLPRATPRRRAVVCVIDEMRTRSTFS